MKRRQLIKASILLGSTGLVFGEDKLNKSSSATTEKKVAYLSTTYWLDAPGLTLFWAETFLHAVRSSGLGPPMVARSMAIVFTAMFDAWASFDDQFKPSHNVSELDQVKMSHHLQNQLVAMSYAAYTTILAQFPNYKKQLNIVMAQLFFPTTAKNAPTVFFKAASAGERIGQMILIERLNDASNQDGGLAESKKAFDNYLPYASKNQVLDYDQPLSVQDAEFPDHWQALSYTNNKGEKITPPFMVAHWYKVQPFALKSPDQFRPAPPAALGTDAFKAQAEQLVKIQENLTDEQKVIAEYWSDGPNSELPPGHWLMFALQVARQQNYSNQQVLKLCFVLSNALLDASIAAWEAKLYYDYARPITVIRHMYKDQNIMTYGLKGPAAGLQKLLGQAWRPYQANTFPTPPFPEYVSGHSTYSATAAEILKLFTGSDRFELSHTQAPRTLSFDPQAPEQEVTLSWPTFTAAAEQAGMSRLYGGIHFMDANVAGLTMGRQVAQQAFQKAQTYWTKLAQ